MLSVLEKGKPIADQVKLQRLRQIMLGIMGPNGQGTVNIKKVPAHFTTTAKHSVELSPMKALQQQHANRFPSSGVLAVKNCEEVHMSQPTGYLTDRGFVGVQHSGMVHHDRTLHQMMLAEDSKAWDQAHSSCGPSLCAAELASRMSDASLVDAVSPSHASPTDSASSLHADCALQGDFVRDRVESSSPLLRCALSFSEAGTAFS